MKADLEDRYRGRGAYFWVACATCGKKFQKSKVDVSRTIRDFCSKSCNVSFTNRINPRRKKQIKLRAPSAAHISEKYKNSTLDEFQSAASVKGRHPSWKNAHVRNFNRSWNKDLVGKPCQNCGYSKHTELAHRKPIASFPGTALLRDVNARENNLVLCPNCHWEFDNGLLKI